MLLWVFSDCSAARAWRFLKKKTANGVRMMRRPMLAPTPMPALAPVVRLPEGLSGAGSVRLMIGELALLGTADLVTAWPLGGLVGLTGRLLAVVGTPPSLEYMPLVVGGWLASLGGVPLELVGTVVWATVDETGVESWLAPVLIAVAVSSSNG